MEHRTHLLFLLLAGTVSLTLPFNASDLRAQTIPVSPPSDPVSAALCESNSASLTPDYLLRNPAQAGFVAGGRVAATVVPVIPGLGSGSDGRILLSMPINPAIGVAAGLDGFMVPGYRELTAELTAATQLARMLSVGCRVWIASVAIDDYGSSITPGTDLGVVIPIDSTLAVSGTFSNLSGAELAGRLLPQILLLSLEWRPISDMAISVEYHQELQQSPALSVGLAGTLVENLILRGGFGTGPVRFGFGFGYGIGPVRIDYGADVRTALGLRHLFGTEVTW